MIATATTVMAMMGSANDVRVDAGFPTLCVESPLIAPDGTAVSTADAPV